MHNDLFITFVELDKAYDRVPRDLMYWCLRRGGVPEKLVWLVEAAYHGSSTVVRNTHGRTEFPTKDGINQGSGLTKPIPIYRSIRCHQRRDQMRAELLFADDLTVVTDTQEEMQRR